MHASELTRCFSCRQGLLEAPKPKVKIANLYRVLGEQAVADPTAMEREARKQMAERQVRYEATLIMHCANLPIQSVPFLTSLTLGGTR